MKVYYFLFVLFVGIFSKAKACDCSPRDAIDGYSDADFIAKAKIVSIEADPINNEYHNVGVEIIELFKGKSVTKLKIWSQLNSSCAFLTPLGTSWLVYAYLNDNKDLVFHYCGGSKQLDLKFSGINVERAQKNYHESVNRQISVLRVLKNQGVRTSNKFRLGIYLNDECLDDFDGLKLNDINSFALYKITIDKSLKLTKIETIKPFEAQNLSEKLLNTINTCLTIYQNNDIVKIDRKTSLIFGIFYYPQEDQFQSFLSTNCL